MIKLLILALRAALFLFGWLERRGRRARAREAIRRELGDAVDGMVAKAHDARSRPVTAGGVRDDPHNRLAGDGDAESGDPQSGV